MQRKFGSKGDRDPPSSAEIGGYIQLDRVPTPNDNNCNQLHFQERSS